MSTITCRRSVPGTSRDASIRPSEMAVPPLRRDRLHGARDRVAIAGGAGDRSKRLRKRRHDDAIVRPQEVGQPAGSRANELHPGVHALARVHEQRVGDRQRFDAGEVDRLRLVVLEHAERRRRRGRRRTDRPCPCTVASSSTRETPVVSMISNGASSMASDAVLPRRIGRVDADAGRLERVGVGPLDRIRRTFPVVADQRVVHVEPDRFESKLRRMIDLRDDADGARQPEAAERRRDAHRQQRRSQDAAAAWRRCRTRQRAVSL